MGHQLCYVILENGQQVNKLLRCGASDADMRELTEEPRLWDFSIDGTEIALLAQLDGAVTVVYAPLHYSFLLSSSEIPGTIRQLEAILQQRLAGIEIFRCDEWLLDEWIELQGEVWFQSSEAAREFVGWLVTQPMEQWQRLQVTSIDRE